MDSEKKSILVITQDIFQRNVYKKILENDGFTAYAADSLVSAVQAVGNNALNLIILDSGIPHTDIFSEMKVHPLLKSAPIIVLLNFGQQHTIQDALSSGAVDVIIKTEINPNKLLDKVHSFFQSEGVVAQGRTYILDIHSHRNDAIDLIRDFQLNAAFGCPKCGKERFLEVRHYKDLKFVGEFVCVTCRTTTSASGSSSTTPTPSQGA